MLVFLSTQVCSEKRGSASPQTGDIRAPCSNDVGEMLLRVEGSDLTFVIGLSSI